MTTPIQRVMGAIAEGTIDKLRKLLDKHPQVIDEDGPLMLNYAAQNDRIDVLELLLAAGLDVNGPVQDDSPLTAAAGEGTVAAAQWLLDHGADINRKGAGDFCSTPIHKAIENGRLEMVKFLYDRGADPNALEGNPQRNALASARFWQHDDIAALLQSRGVKEIIIEPQPVDVESGPFLNLGKTYSADAWLDKTWPDVYDYAVRNGVESMCEKNQVYFLIGYLISQLADGGTASVYANPSGAFTPLMAEALNKIGASRAAQVIRDINAFFPGSAPAAENEQRWKQIASVPPAAEKLGEDLEALFEERLPDDGPRLMVSQLHAFYGA
jgi:ankyrin repeat protein